MRALAVLAVAIALAGCVQAPEQRWIVQVLGGQGATVEVPIPVEPSGSIPQFARAPELVQGSGVSWAFAETEKGPGLRVDVPPNGGQTVVLSARQVGARPYELTLAAGNATHWMSSTEASVTVVVILGDTEEPECEERALAWSFDAPGWTQVPLRVAGRCA